MKNLKKIKYRFSIYSLISILILFYFFQRIEFFNLNIADKELSIGHLMLISVVLINLVLINKVKINHLIITVIISFYIFFIMMINNSFYLEIFISIMLKIILLFQFSLILDLIKPTKKDYLVTSLCFYLIFLLSFFLGEKNIFFHISFFNGNETINYLLVYLILITFIQSKIKNENYNKFFNFNFLPIFLILILAISLKSRQGVLVVFVFFIFYLNFNFNIKFGKKFFLNIFVFALFFLIIYSLLNIVNEYENQRLQDLINLEINTRADRKRLELLLFGINGILENPFGYGLTNFLKDNPFNASSHNTYLQLLYELGVISSILIFWIFLNIKKNLKISKLKNNNFIFFLNLIILIFFIHLFMIDSLGNLNIFIVLSFLVYFSSKRKYYLKTIL